MVLKLLKAIVIESRWAGPRRKSSLRSTFGIGGNLAASVALMAWMNLIDLSVQDDGKTFMQRLSALSID